MIVIIRGAPSIGKSTVAGELAEHIDDCALITGHDLIGLPKQTLLSLDGKAMKNGLSFISAMIEANIKAVVENGLHPVVDWFFPMDSDLPILLEHLKPLKQDIHTFVLSASLEEHLRRDAGRRQDWQIGEKGVEHFATEDELTRVPIGTPIDTTGMTRDEVVDSILRHLDKNGQPTAPADR